MDFSEAVQWWEDWQLRVLVLGSLFLQYFLYFAAPLRKRCIPSWFRFIIWLAYLGSDALAIYALAALFNRHKKQEWVSTHRDDASLEVLWAPILLVHLGGVDSITAYNVEDNELWRRHVLTSVSQIVVAIYVFYKSWSGERRLLLAAILIFVTGILKCIEKPLALKSASISSLMSRDKRGGGYEEDVYDRLIDRRPRSRPEYTSHDLFQIAFCHSFNRLYTKEEVSGIKSLLIIGSDGNLSLRHPGKRIFGYLLRAVLNPMIFTALGLFYSSHKQRAYNSVDVKVTYTLLSCTASLEYIGLLWLFARIIVGSARDVFRADVLAWPDQIAQYSFLGYLASKRKHRILTRITAFMGCEDYLNPLWSMEPCMSSSDITSLVSRFIKTWKGDHGSEAAGNRAFNFTDSRGHWTINKQGCGGSEILRKSLQIAFDDSVLLWHLATEFCYLECVDGSSDNDTRSHHKYSRVISNYMAYLLLLNPEMLMTGARPSLFREEYETMTMLLADGEPTLDKMTLRKEDLTKKIIQKLKGYAKERDTGVADDASCSEVHKNLWCITDEAWALSEEFMKLCKDDGEKMWVVIEGVWVEMLCFSACRCRGYLHAKSLGKGGEYLSYIWLLLYDSGMEILTDKMQRAPATIGDDNEKSEPQEEQGSNDGAACTTSATTVTCECDDKRDEDGGSHGAKSAAAATPIIGDENV